jgi:hypothetical protein
MRETLIAIDPGQTGAIAVKTLAGTAVYRMPKNLADIHRLFQTISDRSPQVKAILENVGFHRPGNSAVASCTFARHCGALEMTLIANRVAYRKVTPSMWMKKMFGEALPAEKNERKEFIFQRMRVAHPEMGDDLFKYQADALGMLAYLTQEERNGK